MVDLKKIAEAMVKVMQAKHITLQTIQTEVPKGFWPEVKRESGYSGQSNSLSALWNRKNQSALSEEVARILPEDLISNSATPQFSDSIDTIITEVTERLKAEGDELLNTYKKQQEGRMEVIEQQLKSLTDKVENAISAKEEQEPAEQGERISPPKPPRKGHKFEGHYPHVRVVVDAALVGRLHDLAGSDHGGNVSQALTEILWNYFQRPALSFQIPEDELNRLKDRFPTERKKGSE